MYTHSKNIGVLLHRHPGASSVGGGRSRSAAAARSPPRRAGSPGSGPSANPACGFEGSRLGRGGCDGPPDSVSTSGLACLADPHWAGTGWDTNCLENKAVTVNLLIQRSCDGRTTILRGWVASPRCTSSPTQGLEPAWRMQTGELDARLRLVHDQGPTLLTRPTALRAVPPGPRPLGLTASECSPASRPAGVGSLGRKGPLTAG